MSEKKYCEDCKWFERTGLYWCCNTVGTKYENVSANRFTEYCDVERSEKGRCGPEGKLFEKKRSFWRDLFSFWSA